MIMTGVEEALSVEFTRRFAAPADLVFDMWTQPERIINWCRPKVSTLLASEFDIRPGGFWRMKLQDPAGNVATLGGTYHEMIPPKRLSFTWCWDRAGRREDCSYVTVDFVEQGSSTLIHLRHAKLTSEADRDGRGRDWSVLFQDLDKVLSYEPGDTEI